MCRGEAMDPVASNSPKEGTQTWYQPFLSLSLCLQRKDFLSTSKGKGASGPTVFRFSKMDLRIQIGVSPPGCLFFKIIFID